MRAVLVALLLVLTCPGFQPDRADDRQLASELRRTGANREGAVSAAWFETGALSDSAMNEFSALLENGIREIAEFAGSALPDRKVTFFISSHVDISHARGRSIYLPLDRVSTRAAPYLHEITHVLLPCDDCALWLNEGFASYVQSYIAENVGGYDGQIFTRNGNAGIDRDAVRWLNDPRGRAMLPFVGTEVEEPDLSDRRNAAAPFYVLSQSLVRFLVRNTGVKDPGSLARLQDLTAQRKQWLQTLRP